MNCSTADRMLDDYLDGRLGPQERARLEAHLASCERCATELRRDLTLERALRQALGMTVQHRFLPADASGAMLEQAQAGLARAIWSHRLGSAGQAMAALATVVLVLIGLFSLLRGLPLTLELNPVTLFPERHLALSSQRAHALAARPQTPGAPQILAADLGTRSELPLSIVSASVAPQPPRPGQAYQISLLLYNNLPRTLQTARFELEVSGPTGNFRFPLEVKGPFAPKGISIISITSDELAAQCQEKYLRAPEEIFALPGVYVLRFLLFSPDLTREP